MGEFNEDFDDEKLNELFSPDELDIMKNYMQ